MDALQADRAARGAIARAKARGASEVTTDDLLLGLLGEMSRFGITWIGDWAIDLASLDAAASSNHGPSHGTTAPEYGSDAVRIFERGAAIAREEGARSVEPVHLLAAFADEDSDVMAELRQRYGFGPAEWRAALARGEFGQSARPPENGDGDSRWAAGAILNVDDAGAFLGVHTQTIRNYIRSGKLPAYRLAGERSIRVLRNDLLALLEQVRPDEPDQTGNTP